MVVFKLFFEDKYLNRKGKDISFLPYFKLYPFQRRRCSVRSIAANISIHQLFKMILPSLGKCKGYSFYLRLSFGQMDYVDAIKNPQQRQAGQ